MDKKEHFWAFLSSLAGMGLLAFLEYKAFPREDFVFLIGSFGASSVLVFGIIQSPLAQPRNLIGGHVVSAIVGVTIQKIFPDMMWISSPLAVSFAIISMQVTKTLHPPGGATALIAVTGSCKVTELGYWYVLSPVLSGAIILFIFALLFNNIPHQRQYPAKQIRSHYKPFWNRVVRRN